VRLEGLGKIFNDVIGNRTRDLSACNIAPQSSMLRRVFISLCRIFAVSVPFSLNSNPEQFPHGFPIQFSSNALAPGR
jgi:hypothetical protein